MNADFELCTPTSVGNKVQLWTASRDVALDLFLIVGGLGFIKATFGHSLGARAVRGIAPRMGRGEDMRRLNLLPPLSGAPGAPALGLTPWQCLGLPS